MKKKYQGLLETLSPEQEEVITEYCNAIFSSGADTEEFFFKDGPSWWSLSNTYIKLRYGFNSFKRAVRI